jgi:hypothetical protein
MTYLDVYLAALYAALDRGGPQEAIDVVINEINEPSSGGFETWCKTSPGFPCATCGAVFTPTTPITLASEVLCLACKPE